VFRLDYQIENGPIQNLWAFGERYEGLTYQADIDLSPLTGKNVKFILRINANGSPTGDRAMWVAPAIVRSGAFPSAPTASITATPSALPVPGSTQIVVSVTATATEAPTPPPTLTATLPPVNTGQSSYLNQKYGFQFSYPASGNITASQDSFVHINLPFNSGTNLIEKYLEVTVFENVSPCTSPFAKGHAPGSIVSESVTSSNGIQFVKESGQEGAAGQVYEWVAYSAVKGTACISLNFVLHSANPSNYPVPPPVYSKDLESAIFLDLASSLNWTVP
jgi:hypothetical protein